MKTFTLSLIALAAVSTAALAQRSEDLRDEDTYMGKFAYKAVNAEPLAVANVYANSAWYFADGQYTKNPADIRRLDEKNH